MWLFYDRVYNNRAVITINGESLLLMKNDRFKKILFLLIFIVIIFCNHIDVYAQSALNEDSSLNEDKYYAKFLLFKPKTEDIKETELDKFLKTNVCPGCNLEKAALSGKKLTKANLEGANLFAANLSNTDLSHANLSNADLTNAYLENSILKNAILKGATLNNADLQRTDLSQADLKDAIIKWANLTNADLSHANLDGADLSHANLYKADLNHTSMNGTNFSEATWVDGKKCADNSIGHCN